MSAGGSKKVIYAALAGNGLSAAEVEALVSGLEDRIKSEFPDVGRVFIEAQSWMSHIVRKQDSAPPSSGPSCRPERGGPEPGGPGGDA